MTAVGSLESISPCLSLPPILPLGATALLQEDGRGLPATGELGGDSPYQASLAIPPPHLWDIPRGATRPLSGPHQDPFLAWTYLTHILASTALVTTPNSPFTSQLCPDPHAHLPPGQLLSDAPKVPSWLFPSSFPSSHLAPSSILSPRPEIRGWP